MTAKKHYSIIAAILIFVVCANLLNVRSVHADGETPTEPPAPTQVETEPTEPPVESTPVPVESTPDPAEATAAPIEEILTQVPESTEVVVLDESGTPVPLATEEAAQIVEVVDPMWCPEGVLPGGAGCTTDFSSIGALITYMAGPTHTASFAQNGIIYFTVSPGGGTLDLTDSNLGSSVFDTLNDYNLTLQGGWNGNSVSPSFSGQSNFGTSPITIGNSLNPWVGNITLNDITFTNVLSQSSLTVYTTTGNITLNNVDVNNQRGGNNTALLSTSSGNINVTNGTYDGNAANSAGFSATTGSGSIMITDTSFTDNRRPGNTITWDGATLSAPTVTLTNVTATNNDGDGITVNNADVVTLNNVVASNNGTGISPPPGLAGNDGSGILINGNAGSNVFINGGTFNNNQEYGVEVGNPETTTVYIQSAPTCTGNDSNAAPTNSCYNFTPVVDNTAPLITPSVSGTAGLNGWYTSNVNVSWSVSDPESGIMSSTGCTASNLTSETSGTTLTCSATNNVGLSNSVSVTVKIDKSAPTLTLPSNITTTATGPSGAVVNYSASATDNFDPSVSAICSPASGSTFGLGTTTVNCSSTDEAGNTASGSFLVTVNAQAATPTDTPTSTPTSTPPSSTSVPPTNTSSGPSTSNTTSSLVIPLTGGVIDLDCNSTFSMFGVKLTFLNLCDQQTTIQNVTAGNLPGKLPQSFSFVMGLDVKVLSNGQAIQDLPNGTGIEMDFPISGTDQFAVLYWNGSSWVEISQQISEDKISQVVSSSSDNNLYQILSSGDAFYKILTTDKTGIFVLVKK